MNNFFKKAILTNLLMLLFLYFATSILHHNNILALSSNDKNVFLYNSLYESEQSDNYSYKKLEVPDFSKEVVNGNIEIEEKILISFGIHSFILPEYKYYPRYTFTGEISHYQADTIEKNNRNDLIPFVAIYLFSENREEDDLTLNVEYGIKEEKIVYSILIDIDENTKERLLSNITEEITVDILENLKTSAIATDDGFIKQSNLKTQTSKNKNHNYNNGENFDFYTDNDKFIRNYTDDYFGNYLLEGSNVISDDPIVKLVPKELMFVEGEHFYIGKEYGFFIRVFPDFANSIPIISADVMIFDIISELPTKEQNTGSTKVEPLFQYRYMCITKESRNGMWDGFDSNLTEVVYPNLFNYDAPEYFLRDVNFKHNLENPTRLNPGDPGYDASDDQGAFIIQMRYNSNAVGLKSKKNSFGKDVVNFVTGFIPKAGTSLSIYEFIRNGYRGFKKGEYDYEHSEEHMNNEVNISSFLTNHTLQIDEWNYLIKSQTTTVDSNPDEPRLIHVGGGYSETKYLVSWKDNTYYDLLQVKTSITAEIVRDDTSRYWFFGWKERGSVTKFASAIGTYEHSKYHRYNTETNVKEHREVVIADGSVGKHNVFAFESKLSGLFRISTRFLNNANGDTFFTLHDTNSGKSHNSIDDISANNKNAYLDIYLVSGNTYVIESWNKDSLVSDGYIVEISVRDVIYSENYGFENEYFFDERKKVVTTEFGKQVLTKRLRTGYIAWEGKSYLTLSAKRKNAGTAYLEYHFNNYINVIDYELALWSSTESLIRNSSIRLEALNSNLEWITIKSFDPKEMSVDKDKLKSYSSKVNFKSNAIRFIIETNSVENENNRGRMIIGNVQFSTSEYNVHDHSYGSPYIPADSYLGMPRHISTCSCGDTKLMPCLGFVPAPDLPVFCHFCGQEMEQILLNSYLVSNNGMIFVTYEPFVEYFLNIGLERIQDTSFTKQESKNRNHFVDNTDFYPIIYLKYEE